MRYFKFTLITSAKEIGENAKVKLREYSYDSPIAAVNCFMHKTMKNNVTFLMYREESDNLVSSAFAYDERKYSYQDTLQYILDILNDTFCIKRIKEDPQEVTMFQFYEYLQEAKRRDFINYSHQILDSANLFIWDYNYNEPNVVGYEFNEKVVSNDPNKADCMYDDAFKNELMNIMHHENCSEFGGNTVHYVLSCRSVEAAYDMTESLVQNLADANRIKSKRIEIISDIEPDLYKKNNHLADVIENNYGGTVVFDLTEKFGYDSVDYRMTCKYIEKLLKKYKSDCLFVFAYNMEQPGFSYFLLPELKKYLIPVFLREGSGGRTAAVKYLESLIRNSEYSVYEHQAEEFLTQYHGNKFTQTEILQVYEQFESWCLNKNILKAYDYNL